VDEGGGWGVEGDVRVGLDVLREIQEGQKAMAPLQVNDCCVAACCSVLQCVAVGCSVVQCVAMLCSVSHCIAFFCCK